MKKIIYIPISILVLLLIFYFLVFNDKLSENSNDWGNFGSYIGGVGSLILSMFVFYYTYTVDKRAENEKQEEKRIQLLKQIQTLLSKIEQYNNLIYKSHNATLVERGKQSYETCHNVICILEIEIRTSFAISVTLAKRYGFETPNNTAQDIKDIQECVKNWLEQITTHA